MLISDRNRGPRMSIFVQVGHNIIAYYKALHFCGSTFIFSRARLFLHLRRFTRLVHDLIR